MVIVGHMSSKSAFGAKNTGQKFLTPKNFWWCRNVCHDSCPGVIFGAGRGGAAPSFSGAGRGRVENFRGRGGPGQPFPPGPGRGGAGRASLLEISNFALSLAVVDIFLQLGKVQELRLTLALVAPFARIEIVRKFSFPLTMSGLTRPIYKEKNAQMAALNNSALLGYWNREISFLHYLKNKM